MSYTSRSAHSVRCLNIVSGISFDEFKSAVYNGDINWLHSISDIGTKTAKRLVLEFEDKITNISTETRYPEDTASVTIVDSLKAINNPGTVRPFPIMWSQPLWSDSMPFGKSEDDPLSFSQITTLAMVRIT